MENYEEMLRQQLARDTAEVEEMQANLARLEAIHDQEHERNEAVFNGIIEKLAEIQASSAQEAQLDRILETIDWMASELQKPQQIEDECKETVDALQAELAELQAKYDEDNATEIAELEVQVAEMEKKVAAQEAEYQAALEENIRVKEECARERKEWYDKAVAAQNKVYEAKMKLLRRQYFEEAGESFDDGDDGANAENEEDKEGNEGKGADGGAV